MFDEWNLASGRDCPVLDGLSRPVFGVDRRRCATAQYGEVGGVNPAGKPWSMPVSRAIGVSARTLQDGFQRYVGVFPTCYWREVRLQRARGSQQPGVVYDGVEIAYRWVLCISVALLWPIATSSASRPRRHCSSRHRKNFHHGRGNTCRAGRSFCHCDVLGLSGRSNGAETAGWWSAQYSPPARYSDTSRISLSLSPTPSAVSIPGTHSDSPMCWSRAASSAR